jgi:prolyl oligopeptidase
MGTDVTGDQLIFGEGYGPEMILFGGISENGDWLVITVIYGSASDKTEIYLKDLTSESPIFPLVKDINARFFGGIADNTMFLQTNWEAPNGRLLAVDLDNPAKENWREVIPEGDAVMQEFSGAGGKIFVSYLKDVNSKVIIFKPDGTESGEIAFPTIGTVSSVFGRWKDNEAFYSYTSFHIPTTIYRYDVTTGNQEIWSKRDVPIDSDKYEVKQAWYASKDSTQVPMFIVHSKDMKLDGSNPALLTGYGGFNASLTPYFSANGVAWLDKGGIYAVPNLRGGGEFGEEWHKAGMREKKQNVFDDFISAAEYLIAQGYTKPEKLAIVGGSNGGLLVGAAMTQRPDLFGAVVCTYPLLDMVRYHKFLVAKFWVPEYGSSDNEEEFKYLHAYSPYHNVKKDTEYPAVLFITGDADTRVAPLHARKMTALMQASTGSEKPILLRYHTKAGHSGGMPLSDQIEDDTESMMFLLWQLGKLK